MKRVAEGDTDICISSRALKEFHGLANAFNAMSQQIQDVIERERQAAEDVKGKVELIQDVVSMALLLRVLAILLVALAAAGIELGATYPAPIVDLAESRQRALDAYGSLS